MKHPEAEAVGVDRCRRDGQVGLPASQALFVRNLLSPGRGRTMLAKGPRPATPESWSGSSAASVASSWNQ